ncbi:MAG TPA: TonB-dependent receptor [Fibrobacteria bacterium]|nr:TonB-dependent receptor [Fibrobacteria bacterium]HOX51285.1 TonB-dependent receptor [Fibrobacteria bacterium]
MLQLFALFAGLGSAAADTTSTGAFRSANPRVAQDTLSHAGVQVRGVRRESGGRIVDASVGKIAAPLHETPRSVTVISADDLRERDARTIAQTLNMVPGVFTNGSNGSGGYHYKARGYHMPPSVYLVDGFQGVRAGGDYSPSTFGIERVVFLRGPAGLAYGAMSVPGGMVNMVTKAPQEEALGRVDLRLGPWSDNSTGFGSAASAGLDADFAGKVSDDARLLYRAVGNWENLSGFTAGARDSSRRFLGSLLWKIDAEGRYTMRPLVQWDRTSRSAGASTRISPRSSLSTSDGSTGIDLSDLTPVSVDHSAGGRQDDQFLVGLDAKARPVDGWTVNAAYRWLSYDTRVNQWTPVANTLKQAVPSDPHSWTIQRSQTKSETERFGHAFDGNLQWETGTPGAWKNTATVGVNGRFSGTNRSASATGRAHGAINIYSGVATEALRDSALVLTPSYLAETFAWNLYAMDQLSLLDKRLILSGGVAFAAESSDRDYGPTGIRKDTVRNLSKILDDKFGGPIPTAGALFQVTPEIAVYGSYATSYSLPAGDYEDKSGKTGEFDPSTGVNLEGGVKFDRGRTSATVSVFHVSQKDVLVQSAATDLNVNGNRYYTQSDDEGRESFGVELELSAQPVAGWNLSLVGAWIDAQVNSSNDPVADGSPVDKTPEWSATVHNRYAFVRGPLDGWGASLTVNWQTARWMATRSSTAPDPLVMPWTTKVDLALTYQIAPRLELAANLENVFDETIVESGATGSSLVMGSPRNLVLRVGYRF